MDIKNIISLLGGVALFLFGMSVMGDSLKKVAGSKMEMVLYKLSGNTLKGILLGTGVTAVIQSSSATSVMVVGFVNSGMMKVKQAVGVVLGAILGTSITGWILCLNSLGGSGASVARYFSTEILTGVVALAGIGLWMFAKKTSAKNIGGIMLGFAVLMYGMSMMSGSIAPLREDPHFIRMLTSFTNPILGVLASVKRGGRMIQPTDWHYRLYVRLWCAPYRLRFCLLRGKWFIFRCLRFVKRRIFG